MNSGPATIDASRTCASRDRPARARAAERARRAMRTTATSSSRLGEQVDGADRLGRPGLADRTAGRPSARSAHTTMSSALPTAPATRMRRFSGSGRRARPHRLRDRHGGEEDAVQPVLLEVVGDHHRVDDARRRRRARAAMSASSSACVRGALGAPELRARRMTRRSSPSAYAAKPRQHAREVRDGRVLAEAVKSHDERQRDPEAPLAAGRLPLPGSAGAAGRPRARSRGCTTRRSRPGRR